MGISLHLISKNVTSPDWQIKIVSMEVSKYYKAGAKVYNYHQSENFVILKDGTNDSVALASNSKQKKFSTVFCHKKLNEFMARGR